MRETQRIEALTNDADYLLALPESLTSEERGRIANIAQNMKKTAAFMVDRDAGPTIDARSELTAMGVRLETYQRVGAETVTRLDKAVNAGADLIRQNNELRETLGGRIANLEAAKTLLASPQPNVVEAAGIVANPKEIEGLQPQG